MAQSTYQLLALTSNVTLSWPFSFTGGPVVLDFNDIASTGTFSILMPNATLATIGQNGIFNNVSLETITVLANDGITVLATLLTGEVFSFYLIDTSTINGTWRVIPFGGGTSAITTVTASNTDGSIDIAGGTITAPGGTITFSLPSSISNLMTDVTLPGFLVVTSTSPLTFNTVSFLSDSNINISNPDGTTGDPVLSLADTIGPISSLEVGQIGISGEVVTSTTVNGGIQLNSNGTGSVFVNGVEVDSSANISAVNTITAGNLLGSQAYCAFVDKSPGGISIESSQNVASVSGSGGIYLITFSNSMPIQNYGVTISMGTSDGELPFISTGYYIIRQQDSVTVEITDASGQLILSAPNGITVQVSAA